MSTLKVDTIKSDTTPTVNITDGLSVSGIVTATSFATGGGNINLGDSSGATDDRIVLGDGSDISIYHNGTDSFIDSDTGKLKIDSAGGAEIYGTYLNVYKAGGSETIAEFAQDGACKLFYDNSSKLETASTGIKVPIATSGHGLTIDAASNNVYPQFTFNANRSGENQSCGYLRAQWNSTDIAAIDFVAGPDTTNKDDGHIRFQTRPSGSGIAERMRIASNGYIGINCTDPTVRLDIRDTAGGGATGIKILNSADAYTQITFDANRVNAHNALGILAGRWNTADVCSIYLTSGSDTTNKDDGRIYMFTTPSGGSPTTRFFINEAGVWNSSLYSSNTNAGLSANVFVFSDGGMGRASSSGQWKKNVETIQDSYADKILTMRPTWYQQDDTKVDIPQDQNKDWGYWGFIAEEVAAIDPRLVTWKFADYTTNPSDPTGDPIRTPLSEAEPDNVAYERFVPHLVNLLKRQSVEIETLKTKVAALESA